MSWNGRFRDSFAVCGGFSIDSLTVMCLEEDVGMLVDARSTKVVLYRAADVIYEVVENVDFEND